MFIGERAKDKKLSNVRAASAEFLVTLRGIRKMSLEQCIDWIEVTPKSIRIRKKVLGQNFRSVKREERLGV